MNATMSPRVAFRGVCLPVLGLFLSAVALVAQEAQPIKVNSSRLSLDANGLACLNIKTKRKTAEGYEDNIHKVLFSGIAFTEGDNWRAEVTYKNGILDGPVVVVVNNKVFSQFRYDKGRKVVE